MPAFADNRSDEIAAALGTLPTTSPVSEVTRRLLDLFTGGSLAPGTRLPPERQLSATLGVGRSAVREALAALEILGIVDVRPGSGTYLRGIASDLLPQTLRWGLLMQKEQTSELLELRSGLEIYVARLAAGRSQKIDPTPIEDSLTHMRSTLGTDLQAFARADQDFHTSLAIAADNSVLTDLLHVTRSLLRVYTDRAVHDANLAKKATEEHEAIFAAVDAGDADAAASAMASHMASATARLSSTPSA